MIIGIAGPIGSGKSTVAKEIAKQLGSNNLFAFADPIKDVVVLLSSCDRAALDEQPIKSELFPDSDVTYRYVMQTFATDWARNMIDADIWLNHMKRRVQCAKGDVIIQDVRFENEASFIRDNGGVIVHIRDPKMAPPTARKSPIARKWEQFKNRITGSPNAHVSEVGLKFKDGDLVFKNEKLGNIYLEQAVRTSLWAWLEKHRKGIL